jgi:hypothetical protein
MKKTKYTKPTSHVLCMDVTSQLLQYSVTADPNSHTSGNMGKGNGFGYEPE